MSVELDRAVVLGVNCEGAHADDIGHLERATKRVEQQSCTQTAPLRFTMNRKACEHQQRNRMSRHALDDPLGSARMLNLSGYDRIEAENFAVANGNIGLRRIGLLSLQCMTREKTIEFRLPARELLDIVGSIQLLY